MQQIHGTHLLVDGYVSTRKILTVPHINDMFDELVSTLNMRYLTDVQAVEVPINKDKLRGSQDEGGFSVYCQITTSHMSAHVWPLRKAVMLDIFSCVPFDFDQAFKVVDKYLKFKYYAVHTIERKDPLTGHFGGRQVGNLELGRGR